MEHRIVIVGAGPAALATVAMLAHRSPDALADTTVIDPTGTWLARWRHQLAAQEVDHLRSPVVHHPHPEPYELLRFARDRHDELVRSAGVELPAVGLFDDFCTSLIEQCGVERMVEPTGVVAVDVGVPRGARLTLDTGEQRAAEHVVLCTNPRRAVLPAWSRGGHERRHVDASPEVHRRRSERRLATAGPLDDDPRVRHATTIDLRTDPVPARVVVVGGGLTAAQLALAALRRGALTTLVTRRPLVRRSFDVEPGWIGPRQLRAFEQICDPVERHRRVLEARGGGSVPDRIAGAVVEAATDGLELAEDEGPESVEAAGDRLLVCLRSGRIIETDELWCATGTVPAGTGDPLLGGLAAQHPIPVVGGLPELARDLRWGQTAVHLVGSPTALSLGPAAGILHGQRRGAHQVVESICG
ncbi:MAG: SidA/IucD/PvdA family monooxygenase [Acidimicrobiia bacterium]|nr:SidA/IucD/PvdA family monooxygenase [Acidimicrobiia bacterium]